MSTPVNTWRGHRLAYYKENTLFHMMDIYTDSALHQDLDASPNGVVRFDRDSGWGVLDYPEDCGRLDRIPLFMDKSKAEVADWIDISALLRWHGCDVETLISRALYETCVRNNSAWREFANVCNLIDFIQRFGPPPRTAREVHAYVAGPMSWAATRLRLRKEAQGQWRFTLDREEPIAWDDDAIVIGPDHDFDMYAHPNWRCDTPYCRHERDPDFDAPYYEDVTSGQCNRDGCDCEDAYSHYSD